jgi:hypothetical protein
LRFYRTTLEQGLDLRKAYANACPCATVTNSASVINRDSAPHRQHRQALRRNLPVSFLRVRERLRHPLFLHRRLTSPHFARPSLCHHLIYLGHSPLPSLSTTTRRLLLGLRTSSRTSQKQIQSMRSKHQPLPKHIPLENI